MMGLAAPRLHDRHGPLTLTTPWLPLRVTGAHSADRTGQNRLSFDSNIMDTLVYNHPWLFIRQATGVRMGPM
jgi:hypothetical protein